MASNAPLVVFRVLFGLLMALESFGAIATGWVARTYVEPVLTFPILELDGFRALPGHGMTVWFALMGCAAVGVMFGWRYRLSATALACLWTGAYLTQKTSYNNHYYLAVLLCWAMVLVPAERRAALDAGRTGRRSQSCASWIPRAFQLQVGIVFSYAAINKLYPGWLEGDYLAANLGSKGERWLIGPLLIQTWFQRFVAYSAIGFDALIVPALWWSKTRAVAFVGLIAFNLFNSLVFRIGIFPYMVLALAVFFFEPSTIERVFRWIPGLTGTEPAATSPTHATPSPIKRAATRAALTLYFALQLLLPLRHHLIEGDVNWTEEGHRMSWRMMLRTKSGSLSLVARDPSSGAEWTIDQLRWLNSKQRGRVALRPDMLLQFIGHLKSYYAERNLGQVEIYARTSWVSLNGATPQPLIDPSVDLTKVSWDHFAHNEWILEQAPDR